MAEKKNIKTVDCQVKVRKKNEIRKLADVFLKEDLTTVKNHVLQEVIFPSIKRALAESGKTAIDMIFYGGSRSNSSSYNRRYKTYDDYYGGSRSSRNTVITSDRHSNYSSYVYSCDDIIFTERGAAEEVLSELKEILTTAPIVTVSDLYGIVNQPTTYTDDNYGWTSLDSARVVRVRDGYMIDLPRPLPID